MAICLLLFSLCTTLYTASKNNSASDSLAVFYNCEDILLVSLFAYVLFVYTAQREILRISLIIRVL